MQNLSALLDLIHNPEAPPSGQPLRVLLEKISQVVEVHMVCENVSDWPFGHFWSDPSEPRHSKLLCYFINPDERHGCGSFLLSKLVTVLIDALPPGSGFPKISERDEGFWRACRVQAETRRGDDQSGQMDLFITRDYDLERFAIIIENKIKRAPNQRKQLQNYVAKAKNRPARFVEKEIFVFFLPLIDDCCPVKSDLEAIQALEVAYAPITFEHHISRWLKAVLDTEWPGHLPPRIREHLSYYRNLIEYLVNQRKKQAMSNKVLERLIQAATEAKTGGRILPTWNEVNQLEASLREMKPYFERMLRGGLLLRVEHILKEKGVTPQWYVEAGELVAPCPTHSPFDELLDKCVILCVPVSDAVCVCLGAHPHEGELNATFWIGYLRTGSEDEQARIEAQVFEVAQEWFGTSEPFRNRPYYQWEWCEDTTYENCGDEARAQALANELLELHAKLLVRLHAGVNSPGLGLA